MVVLRSWKKQFIKKNHILIVVVVMTTSVYLQER